MKNILFILPWLPYPLKSGGHQAIYNGIKAAVDDYNVFITYDKNEEDDDSKECTELLKLFNNRIKILPFKKTFEKTQQSIVINSYIKIWGFIKQLKQKFGLNKESNKPSFFQINITDNKRITFLNNLIVKFNIDIVQCEMISSISDVLILPSNVKKLYVQHQIDYIRCQLDLKEKGLLGNFKKELEECKNNEIFLLNRFDTIIALSEYDKKVMQQDGVVTPIHVSPAIVSTNIKPFVFRSKRKTLSFVGPSMHYPNVAGILWFLKNCWTELKQCDPEFKLQIIGEWDNQLKEEIQKYYPEIVFHGFVSNLEERIENTIMIVPINIGSGIRMKILEAVFLGIPVVSTTIGAQGLPIKDGVDCFITDDPQIFVKDILKLNDVKTQETMVKRAQEKIRQQFSLDSLKEKRFNIYK